MYFSTLALFALSHFASVRAQTAGFDVLTSPSSDSTFKVGSVLPIVWTAGDSTGTVSIMLNGGSSPNTLDHLFQIGTSIKSQDGKYDWTITSEVGSFATYGLNLTLDGNPITTYQESYPFHIDSGSDSANATSEGSSTSESSSMSSTSSSSASSSSSSTSASTTSSANSTTITTSTTSATGTTATTASSTASQTSPTSTAAKQTGTSGASGVKSQFLSASLALLSCSLFALML